MESTTFGKRLTEVRKFRKLSQDELGKKVEVHGAVIGRYERDEVKPSIEVAKSMAEVLEVSLDYLVGSTDTLLDNAVIKKILDIQKLPEKDRDHLFYVVDNILQNVKAKKAFAA